MSDQCRLAPPSAEHAELRRLLMRAEALARCHDDPALSVLLRRAIIRASFTSPYFH